MSGIGCVIIAPELPHGSFLQPLIRSPEGLRGVLSSTSHLPDADLDLGTESSVITIEPVTALNMFLFKAVRLEHIVSGVSVVYW